MEAARLVQIGGYCEAGGVSGRVERDAEAVDDADEQARVSGHRPHDLPRAFRVATAALPYVARMGRRGIVRFTRTPRCSRRSPATGCRPGPRCNADPRRA